MTSTRRIINLELQQEYIFIILIEMSSIFTIVPFLFKLNQKYIHYYTKKI